MEGKEEIQLGTVTASDLAFATIFNLEEIRDYRILLYNAKRGQLGNKLI